MDKQISTEKIQIQGDLCHKLLGEKIKGKLRYNDGVNYPEWKNQIKDKLFELLGMEEIATNACELKLVVEEDKIVDDYRQIRFVFESEVGAFVPCYLLIPNTGKKKYPVAITLQGHASGFHNSIGVAKFPGDEGILLVAISADRLPNTVTPRSALNNALWAKGLPQGISSSL